MIPQKQTCRCVMVMCRGRCYATMQNIWRLGGSDGLFRGVWVRRQIFFSLAALLTLTLFLPATAAQAHVADQQAGSPLALDVSVGFEGYVQTSAWTPVWVTASNDGPDVSGELQVVVEGLAGGRTVYTYPIELPRGSRKQVTLYVNGLSTFNRQVQVDLVQGGRVLLSQPAPIQVISQETLLIGVWSDSPAVLSDLGLVKPSNGETKVAMLTDADLPDWSIGWQALDVLVISDADSGQMTPEQQAALHGWLAQGGKLVVTGGVNYQRTLSGLSEVAPLRATGTEQASLRALSGAVGVPFGQQDDLQSPVTVGELAEGARIMAAGADGLPLIVWRPVGLGGVAFLAADPSLEPLRSWAGMERLWRLILSLGGTRPGWGYGFSSQWDYALQAVADVPGVQLPSVLQLCGFLTAYIALIGPVNYIVLTRLKRSELAWLTVPGLVILFVILAYVTGFQLRGSQAILHRLGVVYSSAGDDIANVEALLGVWSPRRSRYDLQFEEGFAVRPLPQTLSSALTSGGQWRVEEREAFTLYDVRVDVGAVEPFVIEGVTHNAPRIGGSLTLSPSSNGVHVRGDLINYSDVSLNHVTLLMGGTTQTLADLPAGEVLHVDHLLAGGYAVLAGSNSLDPFPMSSGGWYYYFDGSLVGALAGTDNCYMGGEDQRRCDLVWSILNSDSRGEGVYLAGWADRLPLETRVLNANYTTTDMALYITQIPISLTGTSQGVVEVPPGLMTWRPLDVPASTYNYNTPYSLYLYAEQPSVGFRFEPAGIVPPLAVQSVVIHLENMYGSSADPLPQVELYNFQTGQWEIVEAGWGDTMLADVPQYVDAQGGVELRVRDVSSQYGISLSRLDVTLLGQYTGE